MTSKTPQYKTLSEFISMFPTVDKLYTATYYRMRDDFMELVVREYQHGNKDILNEVFKTKPSPDSRAAISECIGITIATFSKCECQPPDWIKDLTIAFHGSWRHPFIVQRRGSIGMDRRLKEMAESNPIFQECGILTSNKNYLWL